MSSVPRTSVELADVAPGLAAAQAALQRAAYPGTVDLVTRELVRIRSGVLSHCSICRNLRLQAALDRGFDESMVTDPDTAELTDRQRAALRFTDAFLLDPGTVDRAEMLRLFTPAEVAELVLDLVRYRPGSKLTVASGREPVADGLQVV